MTDPLATLHGPRRLAPAGGLDRAVAAGRRRLHRRRAAGTAAGVSFGVVATAVVATGARPLGDTGLRPTHPTSASATAAGKDAPPSPVASATIVGPLPPYVPLPTPSASPTTADPTPNPTPTSVSERHWIGPASAEVAIAKRNDPAACASQPTYAGDTQRTGFCTSLTAPPTVTSGHEVSLSYDLCRAPGTTPVTLSYDSRVETAFTVVWWDAKGDSTVVWDWAPDTDVGVGSHQVTWAAGDCRTYTVTWSGQDTAGWSLPDGGYELDAVGVAKEWTTDHAYLGPPPTYQSIEVSAG